MKNSFASMAAALLSSAVFCVPVTCSAASLQEGDPVRLQVVDHQRASASFAPSNSFSALLMFKAETGLRRGAMKCLLMNAGNGYYEGFRLSLVPDDISGAFHPRLTIGQGRTKGGWSLNAPERTIAAGRWHRLGAVWDGRIARIYVDGKEVSSGIFCSRYIPASNAKVRVGASGESCGIRSMPFLTERAAVSARAMSAEEIAGWAADARPFEGDTPRMPAVLAKCWSGVPVTMAEIEAVRAASFHTPLALLALDQAETLSLIADRRYDQAARLAEKTIARLSKVPSGAEQIREFRSRIKDVKLLTGALETLLDDFRSDYAKARAENAAHLPYVALTLVKALSRAGKLQEAGKIRRSMRPSDFRRCPHLAAEFGIAAGEPTAPGQKGASVSRVMPKTAFYVAPDGDDSSDGSEKRPFKTLGRARSAVRKLKSAGLPPGGVAVMLRGGTYRISQTLELQGESDSGTPEKPVVWCAYGDETPVLDGGFEVGELKPVTDPEALARIPASARRHVRCCDVRSAGYRYLEPPGRYGFYCDIQEVTEFYQDGRRLVPARYPNDGWLRIEEVDIPAEGWIKTSLSDFRPWTREPDLRATGFWKWFWADLTTSVPEVDAEKRALKIDLSCGKGKRIEPVSSRTFFLFNALCAVDAPGEWFLDSRSGVLYVWPFGNGRNSRFTLSSFTPPFLRASGLHDVRFEGLVFQNGRKTGIVFSGCREVVFSGNVVRRFGGDGMNAMDGEFMTISDNVFGSFGHGALKVSGGDRRTLRHSGNVISNNGFSDVENRRRTYAPHLHLAGVGAEVSFNRFSESPSSAIRLEGNDFLITSNLVENVLLESDDQGALDIYFNASYFGNIYSYNTWKNIGRPADSLLCGQAAIRFDGNISGQTVIGNRFINCGTGYFGAIQSCGGRLHFIDNNLFVNCSRGMSISHYPTNYWFDTIRPTLIKPCLTDVCITNDPYAARYQGIKDLLWTNQVSHLVGNVIVGKAELLVNPPAPTVAHGNLHYQEMPDLAILERETAWRAVPEESETGPRRTPLFKRALRAAGQ